MADPVSVSFTLQNLECLIQTAQFYQQISADMTNSPLIASLQAIVAANVGSGAAPAGLPSVDAQSAVGET